MKCCVVTCVHIYVLSLVFIYTKCVILHPSTRLSSRPLLPLSRTIIARHQRGAELGPNTASRPHNTHKTLRLNACRINTQRYTHKHTHSHTLNQSMRCVRQVVILSSKPKTSCGYVLRLHLTITRAGA